jgi:hypothetical protein
MREGLDGYVATPARMSVALISSHGCAYRRSQAAMVGAEEVYLACGSDAFGVIGGAAGHRTRLAVALRDDDRKSLLTRTGRAGAVKAIAGSRTSKDCKNSAAHKYSPQAGLHREDLLLMRALLVGASLTNGGTIASPTTP